MCKYRLLCAVCATTRTCGSMHNGRERMHADGRVAVCSVWHLAPPYQVLRDEMIGPVVYLGCELVLELLPPGAVR